MPRKDHHSSPYSPGTLLKLDLFKSYLNSWLYVPTYTPQVNTINIFDFFCGPGADLAGEPGSPTRAVSILKEHFVTLREHGKSVSTFFFDNDARKIEQLKEKLKNVSTNQMDIEVHIACSNFEAAFAKCYPIMDKPGVANFLFIDPCGLALTPEMIRKISRLQFTDFLLFTPFSYIKRFLSSDPTFKLYLPGLNIETVNDNKRIHLLICDYFKEIIQSSSYHIAPFTIKQGRNTYGLIFGSGHIRGLSKFVEQCWKHSENGDAGIGFEAALCVEEKHIALPGIPISSKIIQFQSLLRKSILTGELRTNKDIHDFSLLKGCWPPSHATPVLKKLASEMKIARSLPVGYDSIYKKKNIINIELLT